MANFLKSNRWKTWKATLDLKTCFPCRERNGKIYDINERVHPRPPLHPNCRCIIETLKALLAGTATNKGQAGADWWLKNYGKLPDYYIAGQDAKELGWEAIKGNLGKVLPGRMVTGGIYRNKDGKLPMRLGHVWYEADINYSSGWRNKHRIVFSNDGLIFVTYDHYEKFFEII